MNDDREGAHAPWHRTGPPAASSESGMDVDSEWGRTITSWVRTSMPDDGDQAPEPPACNRSGPPSNRSLSAMDVDSDYKRTPTPSVRDSMRDYEDRARTPRPRGRNDTPTNAGQGVMFVGTDYHSAYSQPSGNNVLHDQGHAHIPWDWSRGVPLASTSHGNAPINTDDRRTPLDRGGALPSTHQAGSTIKRPRSASSYLDPRVSKLYKVVSLPPGAIMLVPRASDSTETAATQQQLLEPEQQGVRGLRSVSVDSSSQRAAAALTELRHARMPATIPSTMPASTTSPIHRPIPRRPASSVSSVSSSSLKFESVRSERVAQPPMRPPSVRPSSVRPSSVRPSSVRPPSRLTNLQPETGPAIPPQDRSDLELVSIDDRVFRIPAHYNPPPNCTCAPCKVRRDVETDPTCEKELFNARQKCYLVVATMQSRETRWRKFSHRITGSRVNGKWSYFTSNLKAHEPVIFD